MFIAEEFLLDDFKNYRFLTSGRVPVPGVDDTQEFRMTIEAMTIMGINPEDQAGTTQFKFYWFFLEILQCDHHFTNMDLKGW